MNLNGLCGVIHVGANAGQECIQYAKHDLNVLWIEPLPDVFARLQKNIKAYPKQKALNYLVGDDDDKLVTMHLCDNHGLSSSIMDFAKHPKYYPTVHFTRDIQVKMWTLDTIMKNENIDASLYDGMVVDVQGSEALVLKGATETLEGMKRVQVESANFELYKDYPTEQQLGGVLAGYGMKEISRAVFNDFGAAKCFDIVYGK
ncbi:MAG TPA: FkbM family methyltransferase [Anaerolineae bacterium]|nr:FkbM family methyltransferase [Anaerolineae bacterium]